MPARWSIASGYLATNIAYQYARLRYCVIQDASPNPTSTAYRVRCARKGTMWSKIAYATGGAIAASILMLIAALVHYWVLARPLSASISGPVTTLILIAALICGIWVGLNYEARKRALH